MPDAPARRKPRRLWLFAPYVLVLLLFAGWSAYWFYARNQVVRSLEAAAQPGRGYTFAYGARHVGGYPFRFEITLDQPRVTEATGWGLSAPSLEFVASSFNPTHVVVVAPQGVTLTRPGKGAVDISGKVLRASFNTRSERPRLSVEGRDLVISAQTGATPMPYAALDSFQLHIRPEPDGQSRFFFGLGGALPTPNTLMARVTDGKTDLRIEALLSKSAALQGHSWSQVLQSWRQAGGDMRLVRAEAQVGKAVVSAADSRLAVDADGRLQGRLDLRLRQGSAGMMALGATGVLPPETAAVGAGLAGEQAHIVLHFRNGEVMVGPLPIGHAPKLY